MANTVDTPRIFISAAEPSADLHASALIEAVHNLEPRAEFIGVAGPKMRQQGCKSIYDMTEHSAMLAAAIGHIHHGLRMLSLSRKELMTKKFDMTVVIDSPVLNLQVAKRSKSFDIPVLYYIAPQLWAWGEQYRIRNVKNRVDRIACILPFEEPFFRSYGIEASYVGHPLFSSLSAHQIDHAEVARLRSDGRLNLAIMPGSRRHVAHENFPGQLQVAKALQAEFPNLRVLVSQANDQVKPVLEQEIQKVSLPVDIYAGKNAELLKAADLVLVSSGTATLEAAYHFTPMIVMYNIRRKLYPLFKWVINVPYLSLPNILAERELVPEFMPYYVSVDPIIEKARQLLRSETARREMSAALKDLVQPFIHSKASENTARIILDMIETKRSNHPSNGKPAK